MTSFCQPPTLISKSKAISKIKLYNTYCKIIQEKPNPSNEYLDNNMRTLNKNTSKINFCLSFLWRMILAGRHIRITMSSCLGLVDITLSYPLLLLNGWTDCNQTFGSSWVRCLGLHLILLFSLRKLLYKICLQLQYADQQCP